MEDPATWDKAERVVQAAILEWERLQSKGVFGFSQTRTICDALRKEGLLSTHFDS